MKKNNFSIIGVFLICYEILRMIFIFTTKPEFSIELLPVSWYSSVSLCCLPIILVFLMYNLTSPDSKTTCTDLYILCKVLSMGGIYKYLFALKNIDFSLAQFNNYYSVKRSFFLMIFCVIDVILSIVIFFIEIKPKSTKETSTLQNTGESEQCK